MKKSLFLLFLSFTLLNNAFVFSKEQPSSFQSFQKMHTLSDLSTGSERLELFSEDFKNKAVDIEEFYKHFDQDDFYASIQKRRVSYFSKNEKNLPLFESLSYEKEKLSKRCSRFFKHAKKSRITEYLRELCSVELTKEEKETSDFFEYLSIKEPKEWTPLESKLAYLYNETKYLQTLKPKVKKEALSPNRLHDHDVDFHIAFYQLQKMEKLFDEEDFDPSFYQHIEMYGKLIMREYVMAHNLYVMKEFANENIRATSDLERLARDTLKPFMRKLALTEKATSL